MSAHSLHCTLTLINFLPWGVRSSVARVKRETNKMQLIWCLLSNFYLNMFRASLCPSSGEQECTLAHMAFCAGCDGCGCVELGRVPAPHNYSRHNQCRTPYGPGYTLVLLMMGIMTPETCWDKSLIINIRLVASCWFLSLHPIIIHVCQSSCKVPDIFVTF